MPDFKHVSNSTVALRILLYRASVSCWLGSLAVCIWRENYTPIQGQKHMITKQGGITLLAEHISCDMPQQYAKPILILIYHHKKQPIRNSVT